MNYCGGIVDHQVKVVDAIVVDGESGLEESVALLLLDVKNTDPCLVPDDGETCLFLIVQSKDLDRLNVGVVGWVLEKQILDSPCFAVNHVYLGGCTHSQQVLCVFRIHRTQCANLPANAVGLFL